MLGHRTSNFLFRTFQQQQKCHFHMTKVVENDLKVGLVGILKKLMEKNRANQIFFCQVDLLFLPNLFYCTYRYGTCWQRCLQQSFKERL